MTSSAQIIFVCAANVCRSQRAEYLVSQYLLNSELKTIQQLNLQINSAGMIALPGDAPCKFMLEGIEEMPIQASKPFDPSLVNDDTLVFVMEQKLQSELIKQNPSLRPQVFILGLAAKVAVALSEGVQDGSIFLRDPDELDASFATPELPEELQDRWAWLIQELDARRSLLPNLSESISQNRFDIPDGHGISDDSHLFARDLVDDFVGMLMKAINAVLGAPKNSSNFVANEGLQ